MKKTRSIKEHLILNFSVPILVIFILFFIVSHFMVESVIKKNVKNFGLLLSENISTILDEDVKTNRFSDIYAYAQTLTQKDEIRGLVIQEADGTVRISTSKDVERSSRLQDRVFARTLETKKIGVYEGRGFFEIAIPIFYSDDEKNIKNIMRVSIDTSFIQKKLSFYRWILLGVFVAIAIVFLVMTFYVSNKLSKPIMGLSKSMEKIPVMKGMYRKLKPDDYPIRELQRFVNSHNKMTDQLDEYHGMLSRKSSLEAIGDLMHSFSHELKTPVSNIKNRGVNLIARVQKEMKSNGNDYSLEFSKKLEEDRDVLYTEATRLETFLDNLLDYIRPVKYKLTPTNLEERLKLVLSIFRQSSHKKNIEFILNINSDVPLALVDREHFFSALSNMIQNSIKAVEKNDQITDGWIKIAVLRSSDSKRVNISIEDNGIGIERENMEHIFKPHFTTGGNGKGLYLVQKILDAHQASIHVESQWLKGTKMTVSVWASPGVMV